jgi:hypothetical protein
VTIWLFVEGKTEAACTGVLKDLLDEAGGSRPRVRLQTRQYKGSQILRAERVAQDARLVLSATDTAVVVLVDVAPEFQSVEEAQEHYARYLKHGRFRVHCALHDFEAWPLPHWQHIYGLAGKPPPKTTPWPTPERINLVKPPSTRLRELFAPHRGYEKALDAPRILRSPDDLRLSASKCPQLKAFLNTLLEFAGYGAPL